MFPEHITTEKLNDFCKGSMSEWLGIRYLEIGRDFLRATMPVDHRTRQPLGRLHGGASVVLAEELGSMAANLLLNDPDQAAVGLEINANHLRSTSEGKVIGEARSLHMGKRHQVWEIRISNQEGELLCISRLTIAIMQKKK